MENTKALEETKEKIEKYSEELIDLRERLMELIIALEDTLKIPTRIEKDNIQLVEIEECLNRLDETQERVLELVV